VDFETSFGVGLREEICMMVRKSCELCSLKLRKESMKWDLSFFDKKTNIASLSRPFGFGCTQNMVAFRKKLSTARRHSKDILVRG
jgi:hypothetical protein